MTSFKGSRRVLKTRGVFGGLRQEKRVYAVSKNQRNKVTQFDTNKFCVCKYKSGLKPQCYRDFKPLFVL
jgi:hypothetical protein